MSRTNAADRLLGSGVGGSIAFGICSAESPLLLASLIALWALWTLGLVVLWFSERPSGSEK